MARTRAAATKQARGRCNRAFQELKEVQAQREPFVQRLRAARDELHEWNKKLEAAANKLIAEAQTLAAADRAQKATKGRKPRPKPV
jgi:chromosome segregation ATPase